MKISDVTVGDLIEVEMRGNSFIAEVVEKLPADDQFDLKIKPRVSNCSHYHCNAEDVKAHWKKMGRPRGRPRKVKPQEPEGTPETAAAELGDKVPQEAKKAARPRPGAARPRPGAPKEAPAPEPEPTPEPAQEPEETPKPAKRARPGTRAAKTEAPKSSPARKNPFLAKKG